MDMYFELVDEGKRVLIKSEKQGLIGDIFINDSYSGKNSIQACGFEKIGGPWGCGRFFGTKDICLIFKEQTEKEFSEKHLERLQKIKSLHQELTKLIDEDIKVGLQEKK